MRRLGSGRWVRTMLSQFRLEVTLVLARLVAVGMENKGKRDSILAVASKRQVNG